MNQCVVSERRHHEQREIGAAREVALEYGTTNVVTPGRQPLALTFVKIAPADDGPPGVARKDTPTRFDLVVEIGEMRHTRHQPNTLTVLLKADEQTSCPSRVMCHPHENTRRAPLGAKSSTAWAVPVAYCCTPRGTRTVSTSSHPETARLMTSRSLVAQARS